MAEPEDVVAALALLQPSAEAEAKQDQEDTGSRQKEGCISLRGALVKVLRKANEGLWF